MLFAHPGALLYILPLGVTTIGLPVFTFPLVENRQLIIILLPAGIQADGQFVELHGLVIIRIFIIVPVNTNDVGVYGENLQGLGEILQCDRTICPLSGSSLHRKRLGTKA